MHSRRFVILIATGALLAGCARNLTRGESNLCEVHHTHMSKTKVPIGYGLMAQDEQSRARYTASTNAFPHAEESVGGGCMVPLFAAHRALIYSCPSCQTAREQWEREYDTKR